jgi:ribosome biogenesis GTPase / thiamine phosphate phosphatase
VATAEDELSAEPSGALRREAQSGGLLPAVGDWVVLAVDDGGARKARALPRSGPATIEQILPRRSAISRKVKGKAAQVQVIAANVDTVFLVSGLDADFNPRRIERALVAVWDTGAQPVVVLTKSDLSADVEDKVKMVQALAAGVAVHAVSARDGVGLDALDPYRRRGSTIALLGSSGVGKSTLVNRLIPGLSRAVGVVSAIGKGRHTSTSAVALRLPPVGRSKKDPGWIVDTPGVRSFGLAHVSAESLLHGFPDLVEGTVDCPPNCEHAGGECALDAWVAAGNADPRRLSSYRRLLASRSGGTTASETS